MQVYISQEIQKDTANTDFNVLQEIYATERTLFR